MNLWRRTKRYGEIKNLGDESEDFASEFILRKLEGKSLKQSMSQFYKDYLDHLNSHKRILNKKNNNIIEYSDQFKGTSKDFINIEMLSEKQIQICQLRIEGKTQREIGDYFGVSESRICKWIKQIRINLDI